MLTSGFIEPQILNFERILNLSPGLKAVLFRLAQFLLEALSVGDYVLVFYSLSVGDYVLVFCIVSVGDYVLVFYGMSVGDNVLGVLCFIGW